MTSPSVVMSVPTASVHGSLSAIHFSQQHADYLSLVQISDLHLFEDDTTLYNGINPANNLQQLLNIVAHKLSADGLMVTGDLLQQPSDMGYQRLFAKLTRLGLPMVTIAGNHDVTLELDSHLPFFQRRHVAIQANPQLVHCHKVTSEYWDILCLDSSVSGQIYGAFSQTTLDWLADRLAESDRPCVIFAHHPMLLVGSKWIDQHTLKNSAAFWSVVTPFVHRLKGIFVGHVHQELQLMYAGVPLFTCPASSVQFLPFSDDYATDPIPAGLRWLTLYNNGTLATGIKRVNTM